MLLLALLLSNAVAFPGALVGPAGSNLQSEASMVVVSHTGAGMQLTIALEVSGATDLGLVLPIPEAVNPADLLILEPDYLQQVELFSAPRLERVRCDDLSQVTYYAIPPGCGSFEFDDGQSVSQRAAAEESLGLEATFAKNALSVDVVTDLDTWMADAGYVPDAATETLLQTFVDAGSSFVVARAALDTASSVWLEPVQIPLSTTDYRLPLELSASSVTEHDLTVLTFASGPLEPDLFRAAELEADCMVLGDFGAAHEANFEDAIDPSENEMWVLEYSGLSSECSPCARDPLEYYNLADFGFLGIDEAHVTRWRHRYGDQSPAVDVLLQPGGSTSAQIRYVAYDGDLEFAYPVCGQGKIANPGVCEGLNPDGLDGGCNSAGAGGWMWLAILPILVMARRRLAPIVLLLILGAADARADAPSPRFDLALDLPIWSTDRVVPDGRDTGAPHLLSPFVGGEGRVGIRKFKSMNVGITGGLRGFRGRGGGEVRFSFTEPHLGVDARHGVFRESVFVIPLFRYGVQGSVGILDSAVFIPKATIGALLHVGAGAFIGRGARRVIAEIRASTVPRTDGFSVSFDSVTDLPGWTYYPGSANVTLLIGMGFQ